MIDKYRFCECECRGSAEYSAARIRWDGERWQIELYSKILGSTQIYGLPEVKYCPWCGGLLDTPTE